MAKGRQRVGVRGGGVLECKTQGGTQPSPAGPSPAWPRWELSLWFKAPHPARGLRSALMVSKGGRLGPLGVASDFLWLP